MKIKTHQLFFLIIACLLLLDMVLSFVLFNKTTRLEQLENSRYKLNAMGSELKQSSDDLTKYSHTYVMTGDSIWEQKYWEVLDVRNGLKARPDGRIISLHDSLLKLGIVNEELEKLTHAEKNSNKLVLTEKTAFNAMKGIFADSLNLFTHKAKPDTPFARKILFDKKYEAAKDSIMYPIAEFRAMLDKRVSLAVKKLNYEDKVLQLLIIINIIIISVLSFYAIIVLRRKIIKQMFELQASNEKIKADEANLIQQNEKITALFDNLKETNTQLVELNATKDKFFAIIAHDLKNPFNVLLNLSGLLIAKIDEFQPEETKRLALMMDDSAKRTYQLLEELLMWAMTQTGKIEPILLDIRPSKLIADIKLLIEPLAQNKYIKFETVVNSDDLICADENMVKTIIRNLATNAIKYTYPNGSVKIETSKIENQLLFTISDTGEGIEPRYIEKLFNIDCDLSKPGTQGERGTGLGLILCKELVKKNNGKIWAESKLGKGSKFKFTLPLSTA